MTAAVPHPIDDHFNTTFANRIARLEAFNKHHYRPNNYLHKWWARRCGSTFRLILKGLVEDPSSQDYYAPGGLAGKVILDPMMGGGTTLHEAIRLEANVIGADLDPIPVLQARASLMDTPLPELQQAFGRYADQLAAELDPLYRTACPRCRRPLAIQFTLYGIRRRCKCGEALLVDSLVLRQQPDGSSFRICPTCHEVSRSREPCECRPGDRSARPPLVIKRRRCAVCGGRYREDRDVPFYRRYEPLVIQARCPTHGLIFTQPAEADRRLLAEIEELRPAFPPADFQIAPGPKSIDLVQRGIHSYLELFTSRQLVYLDRATRALESFPANIRLTLALLVSTSLEFNSMLCGYKGGDKERPGAIRHAFSRHAYAFPYTALENNPLYYRATSGTLRKLFRDRVSRARQWAAAPTERLVTGAGTRRPLTVEIAEVDFGHEVSELADLQIGRRRFILLQGSSARLPLADECVDFAVTDPPYFDSVQYSDLAIYFRVWLRRMLPDAVDWTLDLQDSAVDPHSGDGNQYQQVLGEIMAECQRVLRKPHGRLIFTYHHWKPQAWIALTLALRKAGFVLLKHYIVLAENPKSVHIANLRSLRHDAILVLAPAPGRGPGHWSPITEIDQTDSADFCQDCASVLGWMLDSDLADDEISRHWLSLLT